MGKKTARLRNADDYTLRIWGVKSDISLVHRVVRPQATQLDPRMILEPLMTMSRHKISILGIIGTFNGRNRSTNEGTVSGL
jgi:hypothetical protein